MSTRLPKPFRLTWITNRQFAFKTWRTDDVFAGSPPPSIAANPYRVLRIDLGKQSIGVLVPARPRR